jgi:hypothetical protein
MDDKDAAGQPFPDEATLAKLRAEVAPPNTQDWADTIALCMWAADELEKPGKRNPRFPPGMTAAAFQMRALGNLLQRQHCIMRRGADLPIGKLLSAIVDQEAGHKPVLFQPVDPPHHSPGRSVADQEVMAYVALGIRILWENNVRPLEEAVRRVVSAFNSGCGAQVLTRTTARKWREEIMQGKAPPEVAKVYNDPMLELGSTIGERAGNVLKLIERVGRYSR